MADRSGKGTSDDLIPHNMSPNKIKYSRFSYIKIINIKKMVTGALFWVREVGRYVWCV